MHSWAIIDGKLTKHRDFPSGLPQIQFSILKGVKGSFETIELLLNEPLTEDGVVFWVMATRTCSAPSYD